MLQKRCSGLESRHAVTFPAGQPASAPGRIRTRDPLLRRPFPAGGQPAHAHVGGRSRCPWVTAGDRSFPPVLARMWHAAWLQNISSSRSQVLVGTAPARRTQSGNSDASASYLPCTAAAFDTSSERESAAPLPRKGGMEAVSYQPPPDARDDAAGRQPPGWYLDPISQQALRWWDGAQWGQQTQPLRGRGQEPQLLYPQQPYDQLPRQPSFTPDPQYGTPPGQPPYQGNPQYPGTPYGQPPSPQAQSYGQQPGPPFGHHGRSPRKSWPRRHKVLTVLGGLVALIIIGSIATAAGGGNHASPSTPAAAESSPTGVASTSASATPAAATARTVATFTGSGQENTPRFTVTDTWKLVYSFNCSSFGSSGNFQVYEDGGNDFNLSVNDLAMSKSSSTWAYNDGGAHYLQINSECSWKVKVVDEP